jgi:hypothetical protein
LAFLPLSHCAPEAPSAITMRLLLIWPALVGFSAYVTADTVPNMEYDPQTIRTCTWWYDNWEGQTCEAIRDWRYGISAADFTRWNPSVGSDCSNWQSLSYCVRVGSLSMSSSISTSSTKSMGSSSPSATPTSRPILTGWKPLGCYVDDNTLSNQTITADATLSVESCEAACFSYNYVYAGVKDGGECWCGFFVGNSWTSNQTDCNIPCADDTSQICGGTGVFNIFEAQTKNTLPPAATPTDIGSSTARNSHTTTSTFSTSTSSTPIASAQPSWQAIGCYKDTYPANKRTLAMSLTITDTAQSPSWCFTACRKVPTIYAGLENGNACWCGNEIQSPANNTPVAETNCNKPCTGDKTLFCGALSRIYLYKYVVPSVPWIELGCYGEENNRILKNLITVIGGQSNNTRENCVAGCDNAGYRYAGVENSQECWCDNSITEGGKLAVDGSASW